MNNQEYINNVTLEYLLNPVLYEKINSQKPSSSNLILKDIKFYRRRIQQITKDMCKGEYINSNLEATFLNYANTIIYYLKQLDEKDILQSDYNGFNVESSVHYSQPSDLSSNFNADNLIFNIPHKNTGLDNFVKKINIDDEDKFVPQQRNINIKDPALKKKGGKKRKNLIIIYDA